jgi:hypothetical protein
MMRAHTLREKAMTKDERNDDIELPNMTEQELDAVAGGSIIGDIVGTVAKAVLPHMIATVFPEV